MGVVLAEIDFELLATVGGLPKQAVVAVDVHAAGDLFRHIGAEEYVAAVVQFHLGTGHGGYQCRHYD